MIAAFLAASHEMIDRRGIALHKAPDGFLSFLINDRVVTSKSVTTGTGLNLESLDPQLFRFRGNLRPVAPLARDSSRLPKLAPAQVPRRRFPRPLPDPARLASE